MIESEAEKKQQKIGCNTFRQWHALTHPIERDQRPIFFIDVQTFLFKNATAKNNKNNLRLCPAYGNGFCANGEPKGQRNLFTKNIHTHTYDSESNGIAVNMWLR